MKLHINSENNPYSKKTCFTITQTNLLKILVSLIDKVLEFLQVWTSVKN